MNAKELRAYFADVKTLNELDDRIRELKNEDIVYILSDKDKLIEERIYENGKVVAIRK